MFHVPAFIDGPITVPYKKFSQRNYFYFIYIFNYFPVLFSQIRDSWSRSLPCEVVCVTHDKVPLKRFNWSLDKLSCKTLFGLLILDLFQFYTLKNMVGMYKIKRIVGNDNNCATIHSWIISEICVEVTSRKILSVEQFLRATCNFFQDYRIKNLLSFVYNYLPDWNITDRI